MVSIKELCGIGYPELVINKKNIYLNIWFNDKFGWAYSHNLVIISKFDNIRNSVNYFKELLENKDIQNIFRKFNNIEYPMKENGTYTSSFINEYFIKNINIYNELVVYLNKTTSYQNDLIEFQKTI